MIRVLVLYPWPENPDHFKSYYLEHHLPLCRTVPGVLRMHYAFEPWTAQGKESWFCIFESEYEDEAAFTVAKESAEAKRAAADVQNYSPEQPTVLIYRVS